MQACSTEQWHMQALPQSAGLVFRLMPALQGQACCGVRGMRSMRLRLEAPCRAVARQEQLLLWGPSREMLGRLQKVWAVVLCGMRLAR